VQLQDAQVLVQLPLQLSHGVLLLYLIDCVIQIRLCAHQAIGLVSLAHVHGGVHLRIGLWRSPVTLRLENLGANDLLQDEAQVLNLLQSLGVADVPINRERVVHQS